MRRGHTRAASVMLGLALAGCCFGGATYPDRSTCGSSLAAVPGAPPQLSMGPPPTLGTGCQVDDGVAECELVELAIPPGRVAHVSRSNGATCAIYEDGRLWCDLRITDSDFYSPPPPFDDPGPWARVVLGARSACAIRRDGTLWCRGIEGAPTEGRFVDVTIGSGHACTLTDAGAVRCWGLEGDYCQTDAPPGPYVDLAAEDFTTCGLRADGAIDCWGATFDARPVHAGHATAITMVDASPSSVLCALYEDGAVACSSSLPVPEGRFVELEGGGFLRPRACVRATGGGVTCFSLEPDDVAVAAAPVPVPAPPPVVADWVPHRQGPFEVDLPCAASPELAPDGTVLRSACMQQWPAELIALEVTQPDPRLGIAGGEGALLDFAVEAKRLAFPDTTLVSRTPLTQSGRAGVEYVIDVGGGARMRGRAFVDDGTVYAITGMYDTATGDPARTARAVESARFVQ